MKIKKNRKKNVQDLQVQKLNKKRIKSSKI